MQKNFQHLNKYFHIIFTLTLLLIFTVVLVYKLQNQAVSDIRDYSQDKNIEDDFVLPSQETDKFLHYNKDNNITVVNYFSLDCPYCRKLFIEEKRMAKEYANRVNFVFREKPISSHPLSFEKALVKECIYLQNQNSDEKYFQFVEDVFNNYDSQKLGLSHSKLWDYALKYISQDTLSSCLKDESLKKKILSFKAQAEASQIFWTPTIVVFKDGVEVERVEKVWTEIYRKVLERVTENSL